MSQTVLITGATGFLGQHLVRRLMALGHVPIALSRDSSRARRLLGPEVRIVESLAQLPADIAIDACIHLAGARVLGAPWTAARRALLLESRARPAAELLAFMKALARPPRVWIAASAIGWYGRDTGHSAVPCTEDALPGADQFQSQLCVAIENDALKAEALGVRVVRLRLAVVLGTDGGAWPPQARAARVGLAAVLGTGRQSAPWMHVDDAVGLMCFALMQDSLSGPVNAVAPDVPTQAEFACALAASFGRRVHLRVPAAPLRLVMGEMADLLLEGRRVVPTAALEAGYSFVQPRLVPALAELAGNRLQRAAP